MGPARSSSRFGGDGRRSQLQATRGGSPADAQTDPGRKENEMAENGKTVVVTDGNFNNEIEQHSGLSLVDFWAAWCGPCRMVAPVIEQLAGEYEGKLKVGKLDVDSNQQTAMRFNIRSIPSILIFKDGQLVDTVVGAVPKAFLERKIQEHIAA
jgi:thioredoxin 1